MATVIDTLILELNLDPRKFVGGQKAIEAALKSLIENARQGSGEIEHRAKQTADYFEHIKRGLLTTVGLFLGGKGAKDFLNFISTADASTGRFADTLGLNIQKLGAWENAIKSMGGSAESVRGAMVALNDDIRALQAGVPGGGQFLQIMQALGVDVRGKPVDQILLEAGEGARRRHPGDRAAQAFELKQIPGMNQELVNFLLLDKTERDRRLTAGAAAAPSETDRKNAEEYQRATNQLLTAAERFSSAVAYLVSGPLVEVLDQLLKWVTAGREAQPGWLQKLSGWADSYVQGFKNLENKSNMTSALTDTGVGATIRVPARSTGKVPSALDQAAYIRSAAIARGIDPDVAIRVAKSEGLYNWKSSIPGEESYGPFQLHYGGRGQVGGLAKAGLGDDFTKATGLDAADPANWQKGVDFALDAAKRQGWGQWFGWKGDKWAGIPVGAATNRGGGTTINRAGASNSTNIQQVTVNTRATDATGIARDISTAIQRSAIGAALNYGQE